MPCDGAGPAQTVVIDINVNINIMLFIMLIAMHCNHGDLDSSKEVASHTPQLAQDCLLVGKVCLCTWGGGGCTSSPEWRRITTIDDCLVGYWLIIRLVPSKESCVSSEVDTDPK